MRDGDLQPNLGSGKKAKEGSPEASGSGKKVALDLWVANSGSKSEHWVLVVGKTLMFDAYEADKPKPEGGFVAHQSDALKPRKRPYDSSRGPKPEDKFIDLKSEATFKDEEEMNTVLEELVTKVKLSNAPSAKEDNCMDYVKEALTHLTPKHIPSVPTVFTSYYNEHYAKVGKLAYGSDSEGSTSESSKSSSGGSSPK